MKYPRYLKHTEFLMQFFGLWPLKTNPTTRFKIIADIFRTILGILFILFLVTTALGFINVESEKDFKLNYFMHIIFYVLTSWKIAISQTKTMNNFILETYRTTDKILKGTDGLINIYMKSAKRNFGLFIYIFIIANITWGLFIVSALMDFTNSELKQYYLEQNQTLPLRISAWYPIDTNKYYDVLYLGQIALSLLGCNYNLACESLFISAINFATLRVNILKYDFTHIGNCNRNLKVLKTLVAEHQHIIRYVEDLDYIFKWLFFIDVFGKSYHVSITLFYIVDVLRYGGIGIEFAFAVSCTVFLFSQMFCIFYSINDITLEALSIHSAIYESKWFEQSIDVQKTLLIVMMRSQRPLEIHVGNIDTVNVNTFLKVLKAGYTYCLLSL